MAYQGRQPGVGVRNRFIYTATASQTTFSGTDSNGLTLAYQDGAYVDVYLNGVLLIPVTDYTSTTKTSVTLTTGATSGDAVEILCYDIASIADTVSKSSGGTFDGAVTVAGNFSVDGGTIKLDGNYPVGTNNVALGDTALDSNVSGASNVAIGADALTANTAGNNTAVGYQAGYSNTTGYNNLFAGVSAGDSNTTGALNALSGSFSGATNTTGSYNTAYGAESLYSNTTASNNTAVGYQAGYSNTTGIDNTFLGMNALRTNTTGSQNTAVGKNALYTGTGTYNTAVGFNAGSDITTGSKNTILGAYGGNQGGLDIRTASNHIVLSDGDGNARMDTDASGVSSFRSSIDRCVGVNNGTYTWFMGSNGSNQMTFYDGAGTLRGYLTLGGTWTDTSDLAFKTNITDLSYGLAEVERLQPRSYFMKETPDSDPQIGFIAQEVELVIPEVVSGEEGSKGIGYGRLTAILVKAIQEQQATITALTARITALES
jgi:trimeric autotransporter adhesin